MPLFFIVTLQTNNLIFLYQFRLVLFQIVLACIHCNEHTVAATEISTIIGEVSHLIVELTEKRQIYDSTSYPL